VILAPAAVSFNMEIQTINRANTPQAKKKQKLLLFVVWVVSLLIFVFSDFHNWGGLVAAGLFTVLGLFVREVPYQVSLESDGLSIKRGTGFLWAALFEELESVEVEPEAKRLGVVFSPKRLVFRKRSGDLFAIDSDLFEGMQLQALVREVQHNMALKQ
jgi:hypothetical protein